jgi:hypothetical protein
VLKICFCAVRGIANNPAATNVAELRAES